MATAQPRVATKRAPIKAVNKSTAVVAQQAAADKQRKAASKRALKAKTEVSPPQPATPAPTEERRSASRRQADHDAYLATLRVDALASGCTTESEVEAYIQEQLTPVRSKYSGPMLILRDAARHYVKPKNGNPCCGDELSQLCGEYNREVVVKALILALKFAHNPYAHLNPGQQSMNLRNKTRAALKSGLITMNDVKTALHSA